MRELFGFQALWGVELHLKAQSCLWPAPLAVDSLVLLVRPQVLQLDQLEPFRRETLDVGADTISVAVRAVRERESDRIGYHSQRFPHRYARRPQVIGDLFLEAVFAFEHVLQAGEPPSG